MATEGRSGAGALRRYLRGLFAAAGLLVAALAGLAVFAPGAVEGVPALAPLVAAVSAWTVRDLMLAGSAVAGAYVLWAARSPGYERVVSPDRAADERVADLLANPPEAVTADERTLTGAAFDGVVDRAVADGGDAMATVRADLRAVAAEAVAAAEGCDRPEARRRVEAGEWTGDEVAAAFLAGADGPVHSPLARVRLWLDPEAERERRVARTVSALERHQGGRR